MNVAPNLVRVTSTPAQYIITKNDDGTYMILLRVPTESGDAVVLTPRAKINWCIDKGHYLISDIEECSGEGVNDYHLPN